MEAIRKFINSDYFYPILLFLFAFLLYARSLTFGLSYLDDYDFLLGNKVFFSDPGNLPRLFLTHVSITGESSMYRPMLNVTFMADTLISNALGLSSWLIPHVSSLIFYATGTLCAYCFLIAAGINQKTAFILSLLFAAHPSLASAAAWIYGRNDPLLAIFMLFAFMIFLKYQKEKKLLLLCGYSIALMCALLTKETAIFFIPLPFLWLFLKNKRFSDKKSFDLFTAANIIPAIAWLFLHSFAELRAMSIDITETAKNLLFLPVFLGKAVFPIFPSCYNMARLADSAWYYIPAALIIIFLFRPAAKENRRMICFGLAWFALLLIPTLANQGKPLFLYEHRLFLPMAGLMFSIAKAAETINADKLFSFLTNRKFAKYLFGIALAFFAATSLIAAENYKGPFLIWSRGLQETHDYYELLDTIGMIHEDYNMPQAAEIFYKRALEKNPKANYVNFRLAKLYLARKMFDETAYYMEREKSINPNFAETPYYKHIEIILKIEKLRKTNKARQSGKAI